MVRQWLLGTPAGVLSVFFTEKFHCLLKPEEVKSVDPSRE